MSTIIHRIPWTRQPQYPAPIDSTRRIATLLSPNGITFQNRAGPAWTQTGTFTGPAVSFGRSLFATGTQYLSRTNPYTSGPLSLGFVLLPFYDNVATIGLWSLAATATSGVPHILVQQNNANLRVLFGGAYNIDFANVFTAGKPAYVALSFSTVTQSASCTVTAAVNGKVTSATATHTAQSNATEYFLSGFNLSYSGNVGEHWSAPVNLSSQVQSLSVNPWQIFAPLSRRIWAPSAAPGGFQAAWARNANSVIQGMRI